MRRILSCLCLFCVFLLVLEQRFPKRLSYASEISPEKSEDQKQADSKEQSEHTIEKQKNLPQGLYAHASCLLDANNNRILFENNGHEQLPMASTTKIMTLIVILENSSMDEIVTVSANAASQPDVQLHIKAGEQYQLKDLLYSLMLESHNDTAVALAEHVGGSVEGFCAMMNEKAASLGLVNTCFETPNGLDAENHHTTAAELAVIASYAMKNETFLKITNTTSYQFNERTTGRSFMVSNKNRFLYMMDGAVGMKTGFTGKAGYCFVGAVKKGDYQLVSVVLACGWPPNRNYKWSDTRKLMDYGMKSFRKRSFLEAAQITVNGAAMESDRKQDESRTAADSLNRYLPELVPVSDGIKEGVAIAISDLKLEELLLADWESTSIELSFETELAAPVKENQIIGSASCLIDGKEYASAWIRTVESVEKVSFSYFFQKVLHSWWNL